MMTGFERYTKKTKRALFLEEMEQVVPWGELCALIEPYYAKAGNRRPPVGVERMLRIYFVQQWFNLSDPGVEEALYDSAVLRQFVGIDFGAGTGAGRNHGVQVPLFAGGTRSRRGDAADGEPAFARAGGSHQQRNHRGRDHHPGPELDLLKYVPGRRQRSRNGRQHEQGR